MPFGIELISQRERKLIESVLVIGSEAIERLIWTHQCGPRNDDKELLTRKSLTSEQLMC